MNHLLVRYIRRLDFPSARNLQKTHRFWNQPRPINLLRVFGDSCSRLYNFPGHLLYVFMKQIEVNLLISQIIEPEVNIRTGVSGEVFRAVNVLCKKYYNQSQSSRALEMIVQAYWVECYEARIAVIRLENPRYSSTEARMAALKEACAVLNWKEKDLRNRMFVSQSYVL